MAVKSQPKKQWYEIEKIPEEITECSNLKRLFLSNNQLKAIPKSIFKLETLTDLLLDNNRLLDVPDCLYLKSIPILKLRGNKYLVRTTQERNLGE